MSASLAPECNEVKERYDTCFLKWYSEEYVTKKSKVDKCLPLLRQYQTCLSKALKEKNLDTMLAEARESTPENDAQHLRR